MATILSASNTAPARPEQTKRHLLSVGLLCGVLVLLVWSWFGTEMDLIELGRRSPYIASFLDGMFPPDLAWEDDEARPFPPALRVAIPAAVTTLQICLLGTAMGTAGALLLGFFAADNLTPNWVHHPIKIFLGLVRSVPVLILGLLFFIALGFKPMPGVLAIAIHSMGMLGKLFAEESESVAPGVWESMDSAGANWFQKVRYAIWPQVAPEFCSLTLFRLEMNIRDSAVLGFIGIGTLGLHMNNYRKGFEYPSVCTFIIVTMLLVLAIDQVSFHIRRHLR